MGVGKIRKIIVRATVCDAVRKITVIAIKDMKK